jgi:hypothetical protein
MVCTKNVIVGTIFVIVKSQNTSIIKAKRGPKTIKTGKTFKKDYVKHIKQEMDEKILR